MVNLGLSLDQSVGLDVCGKFGEGYKLKAPFCDDTLEVQVFLTGARPEIILPEASVDPEAACRFLEAGGVLYFPKSPLMPDPSDLEFLLNQRQQDSGYHNIAYKPKGNHVTGIRSHSAADADRLRQVMKTYCDTVIQFLEQYLAPYKSRWQLDYGSFRPVEEEGRKLRLRARNDLLHVDSFPTRPTHGSRILRVFTNIHPERVRIWQTSLTFEELLAQFRHEVKPLSARQSNWIPKLASLFGIKAMDRSPYDRWMLDFHNFLKENAWFQETCPKATWTFAPGSSWMVYTDSVSHAALFGSHALEQTFIIGLDGMQTPEKAPITLLRACYAGGVALNRSSTVAFWPTDLSRLRGADGAHEKLVAATVLQRDVPVYVEAIGQTRGSKEIEIRARVEGFIESVPRGRGAGAGAENVIGTAVFWGMLIATALGVFLIPGNFAFVQGRGVRRRAAPKTAPAVPSPEVAL